MATSTFAELLKKKAESYELEANQNRIIIDDWRVAIRELYSQIRGWIGSSDPEGILEIEERSAELTEPNVGRYSVPRLDIRAFGKWVGIIPKALKTIKSARPPRSGAPVRATGRVDITDELVRFVLYRFTDEGVDSWFIEGPSEALQPLTQQRFEDALMSYFQ